MEYRFYTSFMWKLLLANPYLVYRQAWGLRDAATCSSAVSEVRSQAAGGPGWLEAWGVLDRKAGYWLATLCFLSLLVLACVTRRSEKLVWVVR